MRERIEYDEAVFQLQQSIDAVVREEVDSLKGIQDAERAAEQVEKLVRSEKRDADRKSRKRINKLNAPKVQFRPPPKFTVSAEESNANVGATIRLTNNDMLYAETALIDAIWIFKERIDPDALAEGIQAFLNECPSFAGRISRDKSAIDLTNDGVPLTVQYASGSYLEMESDPLPREDWLDKRDLDKVFQGQEPILTFCLTNLMEGGCVLGVVVSHGAAGGRGWFGLCLPRIARKTKLALGLQETELGELGKVVPSENRLALPQASRCVDDMELVVSKMKYKPMNFNDKLLGSLKRSLFYYALKSAIGRPRVLVKFTTEELEKIKSAALEECTKAKWLSTGEALAAHLAQVLSSLSPNPVFKPDHVVCIVDHASFLKKEVPKDSVANTFYLYSIPLSKPADEWSLGGLAEHIHLSLRDLLSEKDQLIGHMELHEDLISCNYQPNPELKLSLPFVFNNQSKFTDLIDLDFGVGIPERYIPHTAGDSILCTPSADGMEVWLSTVNGLVGDPTRLASPEFQEKLHMYQ